MRRYSGFTNRRDDGEYGEAGNGSTGATACSGLTRIAPAPVDFAQRVNAARSARSPTPHEAAERTPYSCSIHPQVRGTSGSGPAGTTGAAAWGTAGGPSSDSTVSTTA